MKLSLLLRIAAIYTAIAGLAFILAPRAFGAGAVPADPSAALVAYLRLFGSPLLGIAVLDWTARNAEPSAARDAIILGNIVGFGAIAAVDIWGMFNGAREVGKVFGVVHLLFAVAFIVVGRRNLSARAGQADRNAARLRWPRG